MESLMQMGGVSL